MSATETTESDKIESVRPPEILCQVFQLAVGSDGIKALLPLTHVCARWRRTALGDPSLWTTIYSSQTTGPLLDMILAHAGSQLFTVFIDHHDLCRLIPVFLLVHRIEELHYSIDLRQLPTLLCSLGPAPNLKVLHLRPEPAAGPGGLQLGIDLPSIFSGVLPSLRDLVLTGTVAWPIGLFGGLTSFECGVLDHYPISPVHVVGVLRESPKLEVLRLVGSCKLPQEFNPPAVDLSSLRQCTLIGRGTTTLIRFITVPASAGVLLGRPDPYNWPDLPSFDDLSLASELHVVDDVSAVSISIRDHMVHLQNIFSCGHTCPGFKTMKKFTLHIERGGIWDDPEAELLCCITFTRFLFIIDSIERVKLSGIPKVELSSIIGFLSSSTSGVTHTYSSPNLKRLRIETIPLHSPKSLLKEFDTLFRKRKELGVPLRSVKVKVKCELLIPAADHCAYLSSWEDLIGEGVRLEYERTTVEELPKYRRHDYVEGEDGDRDKGRGEGEGGDEDEDEGNDGDEDKDKDGSEQDYEEGDGDTDGDEGECGGDEDGSRKAGVGDSGDDCVGWEGWPGQWPTTRKEMRGR